MGSLMQNVCYALRVRGKNPGFTLVAVLSLGLGIGANTNQAISHLVSGNFFRVLGAEPTMGRAIAPSDADAPGRNPVAVISYRFWQQVLSADPEVIGRAITINGTLFSIIGVMPEKFYGVELTEESTDMWLPITMQQEAMVQPSLLNPHGLYWMHLMGRLNEGANVTPAQAWLTNRVKQFMLARDGGNVSAARRKEIQGVYVELPPGGQGISHLREQYSQSLYILMFVVVLVLVIACANLANFLLAKAASCEREISTRAQNEKVLWMILKESMLLLAVGIGVGIPATLAARRLIQTQLFGLKASDPLTLASAVLIIACVTLLAAFLPARRAAKVDPMVALRYE